MKKKFNLVPIIVTILILGFIKIFILDAEEKETKSNFKLFKGEELNENFNDIAGLESAKKDLKDFILYPEKFKKLGIKPPNAILLYGPPGNGKTALARALAGEAKVNFIATTGTDFVQKWVGLGAARVRSLFKLARKNKPAIIFIDEFEALVPKRNPYGFGGTSEYHSTVNQFLSELDGFDTKANEGVFLITATNHLKNIDPAVVRSGRFDSKIYIGKPDRKSRLSLLKMKLKKITVNSKVKAEALLNMTVNFSAADVTSFVNNAAMDAAREGSNNIEMKHFIKAAKKNK